MRKALGSILLVFVTGRVDAQPASQLSKEAREFVSVDAPVVALLGVQVVDGTGGPPKAAQAVVIENGRIKAVGPVADVAVPAGAQRLELEGHTVIPGIVGMHNHTFYTTSERESQMNVTSPRLYLASGVTTIRTTGSFSPYSEINLKRSIESGEIAGPRMHVTGPYISGKGAATTMAQVTTPEDARRVVSYWADEGATWFKAYTLISRAELEAAIDEAHRRGLKFTAHLCSVTFPEAVDLGIDGLEHGFFTNTEYDADKKPDECPADYQKSLQNIDIRGEQVQATVRHMIEKGVALTSTLAVYELYVPGRPPLEDRVLRAIAPEAREEYLVQRKEIAAAAKDSVMGDIFPRAQAFEHMFYKAGGLLAAGVDPTGNGGALPGFGDQRNYELLLEAEFTPAEALQIMTLNGAKVLGVDKDLGSIAAGKIADLVLIQGDPVTRHAEIRNVVTVFKDGVGYDSKKLIDSVDGLVGIQ
ncbi:MAG TPA: amidohydrolase family protein [Vicinamibacteria bacterium]|nr:amidohydrolase family protein [Vicinamibacteria bacterium]